MIFQKESIEAILAGRKTMTRRIVKYGENYETTTDDKKIGYVFKEGFKTRTKWQVGKKYAVCPGRGKPQVWYCPKCLKLCENKIMLNKKDSIIISNCSCHIQTKPLFVEITEIRKEKLLEISEEDAKEEGFSCRGDFYLTFAQINKKLFEKHCQEKEGKWNPDVWVLEFWVGS